MLKEKHIAFSTKVLIVLLVVVVGFASGSSLTVLYARHHHKIAGVDYPHNPAAYYSPTTVDYADSPSTYALRDLAANGGSVIDYTRLAKSIVHNEAIPPWLQAFLEKIAAFKQMTKPLDKGTIMTFDRDTSDLNSLAESHKPAMEFDVSAFESGSEDGVISPEQYAAQVETINRVYDDALIRYAATEYDQQAYVDAANRALEAALNANGQREVEDAMSQLRRIEVLQAQDKQLLLQSGGRVRSIETLNQSAKEDASRRVVENGMQNIYDPSDPNDKKIIDSMAEQSGVKPYESIGMPDFK